MYASASAIPNTTQKLPCRPHSLQLSSSTHGHQNSGIQNVTIQEALEKISLSSIQKTHNFHNYS